MKFNMILALVLGAFALWPAESFAYIDPGTGSILIQGYLLYISRYVPRILSVLLIVASLTYFAYSLATVALVDYDAYAGIFEMMLVFIALPAELLLALWLLIKGVNLEASEPRNTAEQMPAEALSS